MNPANPSHDPSATYSRRRFLGGAISLPLLGQVLVAKGQESPAAASAPPAAPTRKIKLGYVGYGGRGSLLAGYFKNHGGYEFWAVADYFPQVAEKSANARFVKVIHNGKTVQQNVELTGPTRGGYEPEKATGPLRLQGDHGPVAYRNIRVRPVTHP